MLVSVKYNGDQTEVSFATPPMNYGSCIHHVRDILDMAYYYGTMIPCACVS